MSRWDVVVMRDHRVYTGRILENDDRSKVVIRQEPSGVILTLEKADVQEIRPRATAEEAVARAFKQYPEQLADLAQRALRKFAGNRSVEAVVLKALEAATPAGNPDVLTLLTERYLAGGDPAAAEKTARALLARRNTAYAYCLLGRALAGQGPEKEKEADAALAQALKLSPDDENAMVARAEFLTATRRPEEARRIFTDALARNPQSIAAWVGSGYVALRQGQLDEAVASFDKALALDAQNIKAKLGLAAAKALQKDFNETYRLANDVLLIQPENAQAYGLQAYARLLAGGEEEKQALTRIGYALDGLPGEPRYKVLRAVALDRQARVLEAAGKPQEAQLQRQEAAKVLAEVAESTAPDPWASYLLAEMRFRQGDYEAALAGFKRTAELSASYAPAQQAVGSAALALKNWPEAEQAFRRAVELDPKNLDASAGLGLALLGQGRIPEAREALKKVYDAERRNVAALCGLGYIANLEKNENSVRELFHQALAADGDCQYAAGALAELYAFRGLKLDYVTFAGPPPGKWTVRGAGLLKPVIADGALVWRGTQGVTPSVKYEFAADTKALDFVRLEADLDIAPDSPAALALRIASGSGAATSFEFEFGKDDGAHLSYRVRDYSGVRPWTQVEGWPASGKARLAIATEDLTEGTLNLYVNAVHKGHLELKLQRPGRMVAGVFLQAPSKATVEAYADNLVLVSRQTVGGEEELTGPGELVPATPKKAGEAEPKAGEPKTEEPKKGEPAAKDEPKGT